MPKRVLVTDAGSGASNNLARSLRAGEADVVLVGCHADAFLLRNASTDRKYLVPPARDPRFADAIARVVERERIDLIVPNTDAAVVALSDARRRFPDRLFLPRRGVVDLCQDKLALARRLAAHGIPVPTTVAVRAGGGLAAAFRRLRPAPVWCRIRTGSGSRGAAPMLTAGHARSWIAYWGAMRGVTPDQFTLAEYLPGRDFACQMLWRDGGLVLAKTCERLSYFGGGGQPSGRSSIAALAKTVREPAVVDVCARAVRALDRRASGAFSVDLKENRDGVPCITEINVGRFITLMNLLDLTGKHNMTSTYVRLGLGEPVELRDEYDAPDDHYFVRDVDSEPLIFHADEFFDGIEDARVTAPGSARATTGRG
jgi:hypothetical protein